MKLLLKVEFKNIQNIFLKFILKGDTTGEMLIVFKEAPETDQAALIAHLTAKLADCQVVFDADQA